MIQDPKPSVELRKKLLAAGKDDPLEIVNTFFTKEWVESEQRFVSDNIHSDYWTSMVCVLAERITKLEKELKNE